ncbi:hypothetical protein MKW92_014213 [Papaver armeniacum]|nr:hypothetical protein MKW92_014213 [Papaver armeniacum]
MKFLSLFSLPLSLCFFALIFMVVILNKRNRSKTRNSSSPSSKLPPGPWRLPFIGNLHQILVGRPHQSLRDLAMKYGPLMHLQLGEISAVVVSSPNMAEQIIKKHDINFANRGELLAAEIVTYGYMAVAFAPYGDYWRQLRKIFSLELLSTKRVRSFRSLREEEMLNVIRNISSMAGSEINISEIIFNFANDVVVRATCGQKCKDKDVLISSLKEVLNLAGGFDVADLFPSFKLLHAICGIKPKLERLQKKLDKIVENIIEEHRETRSSKVIKTSSTTITDDHQLEGDFLDALLHIQETGGGFEFPVATDNIKAVFMDIFSAGTDTSSTTVEWAMSEMIRNPRIMKKAQAEVRAVLNKNNKEVDESSIHELVYLKQVINETLRLHPPLPLLLPRQSKENCVINEYEIPMKTKTIVNAWAIGRDREYWGDDAESFVPERFDDGLCSVDFKGTHFGYIPFGAGRRMCPGMSFGIANVEILLSQLVYHFDWKLPNGVKQPGDLNMSEAFGVAVRRTNELYLIPVPFSNFNL